MPFAALCIEVAVARERSMSENIFNPAADMARNGRIENLFPTPLFSYVFKDVESLNAELRDLILERERTTKSAKKSNIGGWQSDVDFLSWGGSAVATLGRYMSSAVEAATRQLPLVAPQLQIGFELVAWAAVSRKGNYNTSHVHPLSTWSGVYYIDPGDEPPSGFGAALEFEHPIQSMVMNFFPGLLPSTLCVRPQAGLVVLFPSSLVHNVRIYDGERPRVCVPFNAHTHVVPS
jgi:uncharacterized protein (TIGR02466 family)